jgi:hypothetical protein
MESLFSWPTGDTASLTRVGIVRWWEARRWRFNLCVGVVGVASWLLVMIAGSAAVEPGVDFEEPLVMITGPFVFALMANVCYTLGWLVDTVAFRGAPRTRLYKAGMAFSVVITALPGIWAVVAWLITVITGQKLKE